MIWVDEGPQKPSIDLPPNGADWAVLSRATGRTERRGGATEQDTEEAARGQVPRGAVADMGSCENELVAEL